MQHGCGQPTEKKYQKTSKNPKSRNKNGTKIKKTYEEKLERNLLTLEAKRERRDLIVVYRILKNIEKLTRMTCLCGMLQKTEEKVPEIYQETQLSQQMHRHMEWSLEGYCIMLKELYVLLSNLSSVTQSLPLFFYSLLIFGQRNPRGTCNPSSFSHFHPVSTCSVPRVSVPAFS